MFGNQSISSKNLPDKKRQFPATYKAKRSTKIIKSMERADDDTTYKNQSVSKNLPAIYEGNGSTETSRWGIRWCGWSIKYFQYIPDAAYGVSYAEVSYAVSSVVWKK